MQSLMLLGKHILNSMLNVVCTLFFRQFSGVHPFWDATSSAGSPAMDVSATPGKKKKKKYPSGVWGVLWQHPVPMN
jgi:hypothetical protein